MRRFPLYRALWKPQLYMGVEAPVWLIIGLSCSIMGYAATDWATRIYAAVLAVVLFVIGRIINAKEPQFFAIMFRYIKYQSHYLSVAKWPSTPDKPYNKK